MILKKFTSTIVLIALAGMTLVACGEIPSSYQAEYQDKAQGVTFDLTGSAGELTLPGGRKIKSDQEDLKFEDVLAGTSGLYLQKNAVNSDILDVYWLIPNKTTKVEKDGFVWYQAEALFTFIDKNNDSKVSALDMEHCTDGLLMLNVQTKQVQMGCPAGAKVYHLVKTKSLAPKPYSNDDRETP